MKISQLSTIILTILLLLVPLAIWIEINYFDIWHSQAVLTEIEEVPSPHTQAFTSGTILPDTINEAVTLTSADNPILLEGLTTVTPNGSLSLTHGAQIYTNSMSQLVIDGTLTIDSTSSQPPVAFTTNEKYPTDKTWLGILISEGGQANITHAVIRHGSPGITCRPGSQANITGTIIEAGSLGVFTETPACNITNTIIRSVFDGVIAPSIKPSLTNVDIYSTHKNIITFDAKLGTTY